MCCMKIIFETWTKEENHLHIENKIKMLTISLHDGHDVLQHGDERPIWSWRSDPSLRKCTLAQDNGSHDDDRDRDHPHVEFSLYVLAQLEMKWSRKMQYPSDKNLVIFFIFFYKKVVDDRHSSFFLFSTS